MFLWKHRSKVPAHFLTFSVFTRLSPQLKHDNFITPWVIVRSSWVEEWQEGGVLFTPEYFLANSLVSFSFSLVFRSCVYRQFNLCGWLLWFFLVLNLSRHPGLSAWLLCSLLIGWSSQSHFHPYGTYSVFKRLVYIPFIYGTLVCVSYPLIRWSAASVSQHVLLFLILAQQSSLAHLPFLFWFKSLQSPGRKSSRWDIRILVF